MTMQLFSFGHPCEHQLRRTCIGGNSCPLNGYPDAWCCSYVKGKINFKRDKPCEGARCRWGFTHPTPQQFDAVTQIINEGRTIATKLDEAKGGTDILSFQIDSVHISDTVHCALHLMHNAASTCGRGVGQLLCYAALRAQDPKVFTQLLKTMKKPIDKYVMGAFEFIMHASKSAKGGKGKEGSKSEAMAEELRGDIVDVMAAALSQGGQLVHRDDQQALQAVFLTALKTFPKHKKRQELLEAATAKFKNTANANPPPPATAAGAATNAASGAGAASDAGSQDNTALPASVIKSMQEAPALGSTTPTVATATSKKKMKAAAAAAASSTNSSMAGAPEAATGGATAAATSTAAPAAPVAAAVAAPPPQRVQHIGISKHALSASQAAPHRPYEPIHYQAAVDVPFLGGLLGIGAPGVLGVASSKSGLERLSEGLPAAAAATKDAFSPFAATSEDATLSWGALP